MITIVGSSNVDFIIYNKRLPAPGETVYGKEMIVTAGGKGANQAAAAARLGARTCFLSKLGGTDRNAQVLWDGLKWAGVDTARVEVVQDSYCGSAFVTIDEDAQNCIIIIKGANEYITPEYIEKNKECIINSKLCMTEFGIAVESAEYALNIARRNGVTAILNPAPVFPISDKFYKIIDIITPNEVEARDLTGIEIINEKSAAEAASFFHGKGVKNVLITMGKRGAFISNGQNNEFIKCYDVKPIDTSGAGDSFSGGFAYALWKGRNIFEATRFANAVATISVTRKGTMPSMPTLSEVENLIEKMG